MIVNLDVSFFYSPTLSHYLHTATGVTRTSTKISDSASLRLRLDVSVTGQSSVLTTPSVSPASHLAPAPVPVTLHTMRKEGDVWR